MKTKKPIGRPPIDPSESIIKPIRQLGRVSDENWSMLKQAAKTAGTTFTDWAFELLNAAAARPKLAEEFLAKVKKSCDPGR